MERGVTEHVTVVELVHPPTSGVLSHTDAERCPESGHLAFDDLQPSLITELCLALPTPRPASCQPADHSTRHQGEDQDVHHHSLARLRSPIRDTNVKSLTSPLSSSASIGSDAPSACR